MGDAALRIREESHADGGAVRRLNTAAFGGSQEADIVDRLRARGAVLLSLVAEEDGEVLGHALFTPVQVEDDAGTRPAAALGPMAVAPQRQRQGIGSRLVTEGLAALRRRGHDLVVVLGHPGYYPRFGFRPAGELGLRCTWDVPAEVFMALTLAGDASALPRGLVRYEPEFDGD